MSRHERLSPIGFVLALLVMGSAVAAPAPLPEDARAESTTALAWVKGVAFKNQDAAYEHFRAGNRYLKGDEFKKDPDFSKAADEYREALKAWDHPAIHYNLALALMRMDRPEEVYEQLEAAMLYGPEPLEKDRYEYAHNYKALLETQLVTLRLNCNQAGALVKVDGKPVFTGPGHYEARIRPGAHEISASREGYLPTDHSGNLLPGQHVELDLTLYTMDDVTRYRRKWSAWKPWALTSTGLALAVGGGLLQFKAQQNYRTFDTEIAKCVGCQVPAGAAQARAQADRLRLASVASYAVGGSTLLAGAVLVYLNQPKMYRIDPNQSTQVVQFAPMVGTTNGLQAFGSF